MGERDGMALELHDAAGTVVAHVFRDDLKGEYSVETFVEGGISLAQMSSLLIRAHEDLGS
ncbi:MAG: hypothetical protein BGO04_05280 [Microbacterium sp. 70-38]|mgnify:CR=1 FL=1|nr:MAG: hypothetical protein BGO04_05280 [Microbacterium sp. 70-38]